MGLLKRNHRRTSSGFTLLELLIVMGIVALLAVLLATVLSKMRVRAKIGQSRNLIEKLHNSIEAYNLFFRAYPPDTAPGGLSGNQCLNYYLANSFRSAPDATRGEVWASINAGPFIQLNEIELALPVTANIKTIIDPFASPIHYTLRKQDVFDPVTGLKTTDIMVPVVYSLGINRVDDTAAGSTPNDDIFYGAK